jgi:hypothetical protein
VIVSRANWAASSPWSGITGKPAFPGGASDIGQLTGTGFANKQVPVWNSVQRKFVPANISGIAGYTPPSSSPTDGDYIEISFIWDAPSLLPLQSAYEDFPMIGAVPADPVAYGVFADLQLVQVTVNVFQNDSVRITLANMNSITVDLGETIWKVRVFH